MKKRVLFFILAFALVFTRAPFSIPSSVGSPATYWSDNAASGFASGAGTSADPYIIATAAELAYFGNALDGGNTFTGKYIVLSNDIDMTRHIWITPTIYFNSSFDGAFHTISALNVDSGPGRPYNAFIGTIDTAGIVKNLVLSGCDIVSPDTCVYDDYYTGGVACCCFGSIENCSFSGSINVSLTSSSSVNAGGIAGYLFPNAHISGCRNAAALTVSSDYLINAGGIAGNSDSLICSCSNSGALSISTSRRFIVGGIAGGNRGTLLDVYNTGDITASSTNNALTSYCGGISGLDIGIDHIRIAYQTGNITLTTAYTPSCGTISGDSFSDSVGVYFNSDASYLQNSVPFSEACPSNPFCATGMPASLMQSDAFAVTMNAAVFDYKAGDPSFAYDLYTYGRYGAENGGYPSFVTLAGSGTNANPYCIDSAARFLEFSKYVSAGNDCSGAYYVLASDIDLCGSDGVLWKPVGEALNVRPFNGTFDGRGHTVSDMKLSYSTGTSMVYAGLFGWLNSNGVIKNLNVTGGDIDVACTNNILPEIGGIACHANGDLLNCSFSGTIDASAEGAFMCGGVAAYSTGEINGCSSDAVIHATVNGGADEVLMYSGGIVAYQVSGKILNTFFSGTLIGKLNDCSHANSLCYIAGIAGKIMSSSIVNCYTARSTILQGSSNYYYNYNEIITSEIVGYAESSIIENCGPSFYFSSLSFAEPGYQTSICGRYHNVTIRSCFLIIDITGPGENTDPSYVFENNYSSNVSANPVTIGSYTYNNLPDIMNAWTCINDPDGDTYYGWQADSSGHWVVFGPRAYPVSAGTTDNGSLSADRAFAFPGDTVYVAVTPDTGYQLRSGSLKCGTTAFTGTAFTMPARPAVLSAEFELADIRYAATHDYYTVNPDGTETLDSSVADGTAFDGHAGSYLSGKYGDVLTNALLSKPTYNGATYALDSVTPSAGYTLSTDFSQSFTLTYKRYFYQITVPSLQNGSIAVSGGTTGESGSSKTVTITPDAGYHIETVLIDGVPVTPLSAYTFDDLAANHTFAVMFAKDIAPYTGTSASSSTLVYAGLALGSGILLIALTLGKKSRKK